MLKRHLVPVEGEIIANRFRLVRELGRGSMGTVWLAHHVTLEIPCAIKFIGGPATSDPDHRARFHVEARTIAQLNSPNVVRVLDHDLGDGHPAYIAMEFLDGEDLWSRLHRVGRMDAEATYAVVSQVARGLSRAHGAGIVHRDLKPENIFIAHEGEESVVKLLDFGIAKWTASPVHEAEGLFGTPEYMSPEQARGRSDLDHRADLWSLAVITYQCMTGCLPFSGATVPELLAHITVGSVPVPSEVARDVSEHFDRWWARATARVIDDRFQSASEFADALGQALTVGAAQPAEVALPGVDVRLPSTFESSVTLAYQPRRKHTRFPAAAAGLIAALVATLASAGHDQSWLPHANLEGRRIAGLETPPLAYLPPERTEAIKTAPPPADINYAPRLRRVASVPPRSRAPSEVAPETEAQPSTEAHPQKEDEDAVLDLGI
jgi:serine/threonine protein kinase